ncbi:MAG: IS607 family transposase [Acidobacteria bacterium]|nr:IS607 family transposase [Acidobacteriota bacterium]
MKLSDWAKSQGITYQTAWRWFKAGKLPVKTVQAPSGTILVEPERPAIESRSAWIYSRVSSPEKKGDLDRQAERCIAFCSANGWVVEVVIKEIASGMNDNRPKLKKLVASKPSRIVVEHKDRLTRFGFGYFEQLLPMIGCELVVMNRDKEEKDDLLKDLIAIITSFCCRLYGLRRGQRKAREIQALL